jgi:hypothetical protein
VSGSDSAVNYTVIEKFSRRMRIEIIRRNNGQRAHCKIVELEAESR